MSGGDIDMRLFAKKAGASLNFPAGGVIFNKGDPGECMYVVQSGAIEMVIGERVVELCGPNEAIGFMSVIDDAPRSSTARVKEACEVSVIDRRKFRSWSTRCRTSRPTSWAHGATAWAGCARRCDRPAFNWIDGNDWSEWQDLNLRPPRPERGALPG